MCSWQLKFLKELVWRIHSENIKYFQEPFLVLQLFKIADTCHYLQDLSALGRTTIKILGSRWKKVLRITFCSESVRDMKGALRYTSSSSSQSYLNGIFWLLLELALAHIWKNKSMKRLKYLISCLAPKWWRNEKLQSYHIVFQKEGPITDHNFVCHSLNEHSLAVYNHEIFAVNRASPTHTIICYIR